MTLKNTSNLNLKKTIETTFENAKGWLFAKYPSKQHPESNIQINIYYPENFSKNNSSNNTTDFSKTPTHLSIRRKQISILFGRDAFTDSADKKEKVGYFIRIKGFRKDYRIVETPEGEICEQGDISLLKYAQTDEELSEYISFISKSDKEPISQRKRKWQLNKMMELSRS